MNIVPHHAEIVIIDTFHLREHARTNQAVTRLTRDESRCVWNVEAASGERYVARFVTNLPGIRHLRITPTGIRTRDGRDIPLDMIVYATGFYACSDMDKALTFHSSSRVSGFASRITT